MTQTLSEYLAEAAQTYAPATTEIEKQQAALATNRDAQKQSTSNQYALQRSQLQDSANQAAESASLAAAGNGGSFGGAANIANKKYYQQTYTPALAQSNNNLNTALSQIESDYNTNYNSLAQQLANLQTQAATYGTQRYDDAVAAAEAKRQFEEQLALEKAAQEEAIRQYNETLKYNYASLAAQKEAANSASSAQNWYDAAGNKTWDFGNGYYIKENDNGEATYWKNNGKKQITAGEFLTKTGQNGVNWDQWDSVRSYNLETSGVGNNTIEAFNGQNNIIKALSNKDVYGYLFE